MIVGILTIYFLMMIRLQLELLLVAALVAGCASSAPPSTTVEQGSSRAEVRAALGEPDQIQEFVLPDQPFFGPQESLADILPSGTAVEEWAYKSGEEVLLVWFAADPGERREDWRVVETGSYPAGAVY